MKIISWNCDLPPWSVTRKLRLPNIISLLIQQKPDIICLQEVFFKKDATYIINHLRSSGLSHSHYFKDLLIVSRFPIVQPKGFVFSVQGRLLSWAILDVLYGKAFQLVHIKGEKTTFKLVNTHLLSAKGDIGSIYQTVRTNQALEIISKLSQLDRSIVCGDLNSYRNSRCCKSFLQNGYVDVFSKHVSPTFDRKTIDYVFYRNMDLHRVSAKVIETDLSDHYILSVTL